MKLLVTGASGFIGKNLLLVLPKDWQVIAQYHHSTDFLAFLASSQLTQVQPLEADLSEDDGVERIARVSREFDGCVFLAANSDPAVSVTQPAFDLTSNCLTLIRLLEKVRFEKFIYFSSGAVYHGLSGAVNPASTIRPRLPYAISKWSSENYLNHFRYGGQIGQCVVVRFFGAYGPYEPSRKIYSRLVKQFGIARDPRFSIRGDGKNLIDAMYVEDTVRAILLLIENPGENVTFDLYSGTPLALTELVKQAARVFGLAAEITCEGMVPEYIEFFSVDPWFRQFFGFSPTIDLPSGLLKLHDHLKRG